MTNKEQKIQEEVAKTLNVLDRREQTPVNPFFYGKLEHRMRAQTTSSTNTWAFILPKVAIATLMLLFVCNIFTVVRPNNSSDEHATIELANFAEQYNIITSQ
ncbi:MAG: hypothetical protein ACPGJS_15630 [Flammeovirgaceae bacterium]